MGDMAAHAKSLVWCKNCRKNSKLINPKVITMANGFPATKGTCEFCEGNLFFLDQYSNKSFVGEKADFPETGK
tara:strand:+ start:392 stop:610 length:219 start_codon:yes stop_codon:yes gene_type:complete